MKSYNCGHHYDVYELVTRISQFSKNKAIVYFSASGAWSPSDCPPSSDTVPFSAEEWTPSSAHLNPWLPNITDVQNYKNLLNKYNKAKSSADR